MDFCRRTLFRRQEVDDRLFELGLSQAHLRRTLQAGLDYKTSLTEHNTRAIRGIGPWDAMHQSLGEQLHQEDWIRREPGNFAIMVHPDEEWCIAVMSGNDATGNHLVFPKNSSAIPKGERKRTRQVVNNNQAALGLRPHFFLLDNHWKLKPLVTYFLLHRIDVEAGVVTGELSLPIAFPDNHISDWYERIILTPYAGTLRSSLHAPPQDEEPDDDIDVPVIEKAL